MIYEAQSTSIFSVAENIVVHRKRDFEVILPQNMVLRG